MRDYDPNDPFGMMPEIPALQQEPTEDDIAAAHIIGYLYAVAGIAFLVLVVSLLIWLL